MGWEAWMTVGLVVLLVVALARNMGPPDLLTLGALTILVVTGEVSRWKILPDWLRSELLPTAGQAVSGFGASGLITVGVLFVVVTGLSQTGGTELLTQRLLGRPDSIRKAQLQLLPAISVLSAFLNNTPIVAMFMPVIDDVCKKNNLSPSRLYLPLVYATTLGGMCTLIGTSTNLLVNEQITKAGLEPFHFFELAWVGVPMTILGLIYMLTCSRFLLPDRRPVLSVNDDPRQYTVEMTVDPEGPLVGQTIEKAGLRHLPGLFLAEIDRNGDVIPAVSSQERLQGRDRLVFVGIIESVVDLKKIRGLLTPDNQARKVDAPQTQRCLIEAVVSDRCPLVGKSIRDGQFRSVYNAAVLAIARSGLRINARLGDVVLQAGDTLLLESHTGFARQQRNSPDFFLVSNVENSTPVRHGKARIALGIMAGMVLLPGLGILDILPAAMAAAVLMIVTRCCTGAEARRSIDLSLLLMVGAMIGIGEAMRTTGAALHIADQLIGLAGSERAVIAVLCLTAMVITELVTNNAAAMLMFPIAQASAERLGVDPKTMIVTVMLGASAGFVTPFGYQTNLMVYGPGGYRFSDYVRFGLPLSLIFLALCVVLVPVIW